MTLPDFLIIGAQKAGTTWLRALLRDHPAVYMPGRELHFFNKDHHFNRGVDWYTKQFAAADEQQLVGEKTPNYLWTNAPSTGSDAANTHRRIAETCPDVKLIAILRDPADRAISAYNHHLCRGRLPPHVSMERVLFGDHTAFARRHGILSMGMYDRHLQDYLDVFDREQLLLLIFEEHVVNNPEHGLQKACRFLDLDRSSISRPPDAPHHVHSFSKPRSYLHYWLPVPFFLTRPVDLFASPWKRTPTADTRARLREYYTPHLEALYDLLDTRIEAWS